MIEAIEENLHVFYSPNYGSNVFVLIGKKIALVDASAAPNKSQLLSALESLSISPENVDLLLFTHGHADHLGCSGLFPNAEKKMHPYGAERIELRDKEFTCSGLAGESFFPSIDSVFEEGETISLKPFSLRVLFTPGHTRDSVCFFDENLGLLFSGDTLFNGSCGRTDLPSGSTQELLESLESLKPLHYKTLLPGHGLVLREGQEKNISQVLKSLKHQYF